MNVCIANLKGKISDEALAEVKAACMKAGQVFRGNKSGTIYFVAAKADGLVLVNSKTLKTQPVEELSHKHITFVRETI